jgi:hypothetical protein
MTPSYDITAIDSIAQMPFSNGIDSIPTTEEISLAIKKLSNTAPGGHSGISSKFWKSLATDTETMGYIVDNVHKFWISEQPPKEWLNGLLAILPKKGDLHDPNNYRGIMLLESFYKIIANIIHSRLIPIIDNLDSESQCRFRPGRSCIDAIFAVKMVLKKRQEHGQESFVLFLDLVKAFDQVPRPLLWLVLRKY